MNKKNKIVNIIKMNDDVINVEYLVNGRDENISNLESYNSF